MGLRTPRNSETRAALECEISPAAEFADVSDPHGTGLPADQRPWQPPRPLGPDAAHLARLFIPGTRLSYQITDGLSARETSEKVITEVMDAGTLRMPSGRLVAKDPAWIDEHDQPFTVTVPPGEYPVQLSVVKSADNPEHKRVAAANVPSDVVARLAEEAQDLPDLRGFPVVWHDPADAVVTIDVILSALANPDLEWDGWDGPEEIADDLKAIRETVQQAATRQTRFNFTIA